MRILSGLLLAAGLLVLGGCATVATPTAGLLFTQVQGPVAVGSNTDNTKTGSACASNILGLIAVGDASILAAQKAGNISKISSVAHDSTDVVGLYARFCTVVHGS